MRRWIKLGVIMLGFPLLGGCVAAIGAIADVPSAAEAGVGLVERGKVAEIDNATLPEVVAAVRLAAANLGLSETVDRGDAFERTLKFHDERNQELAITIQRRTEVLTLTHLDVGLFGPMSLNRLMLDEIVAELSFAKAYGPRTHRGAPVTQPGTRLREGHGYEK